MSTVPTSKVIRSAPMQLASKTALFVAACALIAASDGIGQTTGSIHGKIVDIAGDPVAGAKIQARPPGDAEPFSATSSSDGTYVLSGLSGGSYRLTSTTPGFTVFSRDGVRLTGGDLTVNIRLQDIQLNTLGDGREFFAARAASHHKVTGPTPRLTNGKPDLSGLWYSQDTVDPGKPVLTPWAAAIKKERDASDGRDFPQTFCLPMGITLDDSLSFWQIIQTPAALAIVSEVDNPGRRLIYTDGRPVRRITGRRGMGARSDTGKATR
jgi:hypothetical protein